MRIFGVILGILGIVGAVLLGFVFGVYGAIGSGVLALIGVLLGAFSRKRDGKGMGAIVTGAIAIALCVMMAFASANLMKRIQDKAKENPDVAPILSQNLKDCNMGLWGIIKDLPDQDEKTTSAVSEELKKVLDMMK